MTCDINMKGNTTRSDMVVELAKIGRVRKTYQRRISRIRRGTGIHLIPRSRGQEFVSKGSPETLGAYDYGGFGWWSETDMGPANCHTVMLHAPANGFLRRNLGTDGGTESLVYVVPPIAWL